MTFREKIRQIEADDRFYWSRRWWRLYQVAVVVEAGAEKKSWSTEDIDRPIPAGLIALGCQGRARSDGLWDWVGFDLDVGHGGKNAYATREGALVAADRIARKLGRCEIRLSKSGKGVHVRYVPPAPVEDGPALAKSLAADLRIKMDPVVLGRQVQFIWTATPKPDSFKLIQPVTSEHGAALVQPEDWESWR